MSQSRQALIPSAEGESQPIVILPSSANTARLAIRVWTPTRAKLDWTTDNPLIHLIADLISASDGTLGKEAGPSLIAYFANPSQAFRTAKRMQWALLEFCHHRPQLCLGAAAMIYDARDLPAEAEGSSLSSIYALLEHAKPAHVLATSGAIEQLQGLPGLQMRALTPPPGPSDLRGNVQELIWTTPSNLERTQELLKRAAESLAQSDARLAASEPTADLGDTTEKPIAKPTLVHMDPTPPPAGWERDVHSEPIAPEPGLQRSGYAALWWSLAAVGVVALLFAVIAALHPHSKTAVRDTPASAVQPASPAASQPVQTNSSRAQKQAAEDGASAPKSHEIPDQAMQHSAPVPSHHEITKKVAEYDGLTEKDIPRLIRMAEKDAGDGNYEKARSEFGVILRLDPTNAEAKLGLRKLDLSEQEAR
jgi:hypothetical protein